METATYEKTAPTVDAYIAEINESYTELGNRAIGNSTVKDAKLIDAEETLDIELLENYIADHLGGTIDEEYAQPQGRITFTQR